MARGVGHPDPDREPRAAVGRVGRLASRARALVRTSTVVGRRTAGARNRANRVNVRRPVTGA